MKKSILFLIAITLVVLGSVNFTYAAANSNDTTVTLSAIGAFTKIEARGNVQVMVATGDKNAVTVDNNYYAESELVQVESGVLRITSYSAEKLVVYVTAKDLRSIAAYDNAIVKTDGKIALISLDVTLFNTAYAGLNLDNYSADVTVNDQAKADLTGNVEEYSLNYSHSSTVNRTMLVADNATETLDTIYTAPRHKHHSIAINS